VSLPGLKCSRSTYVALENAHVQLSNFVQDLYHNSLIVAPEEEINPGIAQRQSINTKPRCGFWKAGLVKQDLSLIEVDEQSQGSFQQQESCACRPSLR